MSRISARRGPSTPRPSAVSRDKSVRRFAQDDAFLEGIEKHLVGCKKHEKIEKVTGSQDDDFVGGLKKNTPNS